MVVAHSMQNYKGMIDSIIKEKIIFDKRKKVAIGEKFLLFGLITIRKRMYDNESSKVSKDK